jgi:hypothetical protein
MQKLNLGFAILTSLLIIIFLVEPMAESVYAQSTKPSPPKFTIQIPNNSTIQLVVENQAFTNSSSVNSIVYFFKVKDHNSDLWLDSGNYILQSNSTTTVISSSQQLGPSLLGSILSSPLLNNSTLLDFQVQAKTGYYAITQKPGYMPSMPHLGSGDGYSEITFNPTETSEWSNTQTVNLNQTSTTSTTPSVPEFSWLAIFPLLLSVFFYAVILRHRKILGQKQTV